MKDADACLKIRAIQLEPGRSYEGSFHIYIPDQGIAREFTFFVDYPDEPEHFVLQIEKDGEVLVKLNHPDPETAKRQLIEMDPKALIIVGVVLSSIRLAVEEMKNDHERYKWHQKAIGWIARIFSKYEYIECEDNLRLGPDQFVHLCLACV